MSKKCFDKASKLAKKSKQRRQIHTSDDDYKYTCDDPVNIQDIFNEHCSDYGIEYKPAIFGAFVCSALMSF